MQHLRQAWASRIQAWNLGDTIRGYPIPTGGQFSRPKDHLDPKIFDRHERMHSWIREGILALLGAFWADRYPGWRDYTRVYLAGSLASYWWGTPDVDILVGVDSARLVEQHPQFSGLSDHEICAHLTQEFYVGIDPLIEHFAFPPARDLRSVCEVLGHPELAARAYENCPADAEVLGPAETTMYVNPGAYDIRAIKPYAAYCVSSDTWYVHPAQGDKHWNARMLSYRFWSQMADSADAIKAALAEPDPVMRLARCQAEYDRIHSARNEAFRESGQGLTDPRSLQWIVLNRWGLLGALEKELHPDRPVGHLPPAVARRF